MTALTSNWLPAPPFQGPASVRVPTQLLVPVQVQVQAQAVAPLPVAGPMQVEPREQPASLLGPWSWEVPAEPARS